jgi:hypothetical protein
MIALMIVAVLAASPGAIAQPACKAAAPRHDCQCMCAPTQTRAAGLIYMCLGKRWYCPRHRHPDHHPRSSAKN